MMLPVILYVLLLSACFIWDRIPTAFVVTGATCFLLLMSGVALLPRWSILFTAPARVSGDQETEHTLRLCNVDKLAACAGLCIATIIFVLSHGPVYRSIFERIGIFGLEGACIAGCFVLMACYSWALECYFLRTFKVAWGLVAPAAATLRPHSYSYQFLDGSGARYGGQVQMLGNNRSVLFVFYDPRNPEHNRAHPSLHFHRVVELFSETQPGILEDPPEG